MKIIKGATVVVADGEKLALFTVTDVEGPTLAALDAPEVGGDNKSGGSRHHSSSANPDDSRLEEDSYVVAIVEWLNHRAMAGKFASVIVVAPPKALGEMRKHYHKSLVAVLDGELAKDLTGHSAADIAKSLAAH